jgi:hypothetical protein
MTDESLESSWNDKCQDKPQVLGERNVLQCHLRHKSNTNCFGAELEALVTCDSTSYVEGK